MIFKSQSVEIRFTPFHRIEFAPTTYRPGVISFARLIWGSFGACILLALIAYLSQTTGISVLYPPLAATSFINTTCVHLRVARPKQIIVGHFVASIGGLAGVRFGNFLMHGTEYITAVNLGLAVLFASILMQLFDADHPPAAATAAIPAILPIPMSPWLLPLNMAWGATLAAIFSLAWNRLWFDFPAKDPDHRIKNVGLYMHKLQFYGLVLCSAGFILMSCKRLSTTLEVGGYWIMSFGILLNAVQHLCFLKRINP